MERTRLAVDFHDVQGLPGPLIPEPLARKFSRFYFS